VLFANYFELQLDFNTEVTFSYRYWMCVQ